MTRAGRRGRQERPRADLQDLAGEDREGRAARDCKMRVARCQQSDVFCRGQQVTAWQKAAHFSKALRFETASRTTARSARPRRKRSQRARFASAPASARPRSSRRTTGEKAKMYYNPMAIRPFWRPTTRRRACDRRTSRARSSSTRPTTRRYWTRTRTSATRRRTDAPRAPKSTVFK